jgi:hypothetical protein
MNDANTRKVRFGDATVVVWVENRCSLSTKERERMWFSNNYFSQVKVSCLAELKSLKKSKKADIFSYRGMELVDPDAMVQRQRRYTDSVSAVMLEQKVQRSICSAATTLSGSSTTGPNIPKAIRKAYKKVVTDSVKEALENAYVDKKAVQEYLLNAEEDYQRELNSKRRYTVAQKIRRRYNVD